MQNGLKFVTGLIVVFLFVAALIDSKWTFDLIFDLVGRFFIWVGSLLPSPFK